MAKGNRTWKTVFEAAMSALMDLGESDARIEQFLHWALEGARDWSIDQAKEIKTKKLSLTAHKSVLLPDDCVDVLKVGIQCGSDIKTFTHDKGIAFEHDCEDGIKKENEKCDTINIWDVEVTGTYYMFHNYSGAESPLYGLAYKPNGLGYYRFNRETNEIQFRSIVPKVSKIYIEYISDGWDPTKDTLVNPLAFMLIKRYIHWMNKLHNSNTPRSHVAEAENLYWTEYGRVSYRMLDLTAEDVQEVLRESFVATVQN